MTALDVIICMVVILTMVYGYFKGFLSEILSLVGVFVSLVVAGRHYESVAAYLLPVVRLTPVAGFLAFVFLLFGVMLVFGIVRMLVRHATVQAEIGWFDRLLGGVLGILKGLVLTSIMIFMIGFIWGRDIPFLQHSRLVPVLRGCSQVTLGLLPERFRALADAAGDTGTAGPGKGKP
ncbi:MAG: CvpA family protein [Deltaproteobacteria bacterium]|nr:CvpA family protein [Candidatus Anaeroferrophillacea bacterium]